MDLQDHALAFALGLACLSGILLFVWFGQHGMYVLATIVAMPFMVATAWSVGVILYILIDDLVDI